MFSIKFLGGLLIALRCLSIQAIELSRLGQDPETLVYSRAGLRPLFSNGSQDVQLDTLFVTQDGFKDNGLFFAFTAFWINRDSFRVQIWRPAQGSNVPGSDPVQQLNFVGDVEIASERVNATYTVYFVSLLDQKCIMVQKGDRIGFQVRAGSVSPFSIIYDESLESSTILVTTQAVGNFSYMDTLTFSKILFPYKMNFIAYLLVDNSLPTTEVHAKCPMQQSVESFTTTTPALIHGDTGPPGDIGDTGPSGAFGLIGEVGPTGQTGPAGPTGAVGATGDTGGTGFTGLIGSPGDQGHTGNTGAFGDTGGIGNQGDTGPPGLDGSPGLLIYINTTDNSSYFGALVNDLSSSLSWKDSVWKSERIMIGLLIWFALLSLLTIIFLFVIAFLCSKFRARTSSGLSSSIGQGWNTLGTSEGSDLGFAISVKCSTMESRKESVIRDDDGLDTMRVYTSDENLRVLREDTFKDLTNETIAM